MDRRIYAVLFRLLSTEPLLPTLFLQSITSHLEQEASTIPEIDLSGMRKVIFEKAVGLFAETSFDVVTMDDIAKAINRKKSGLYNHFSSKQEILDTMYDFFVNIFLNSA